MKKNIKTSTALFNSTTGRYFIILAALAIPSIALLYPAGYLGGKGITAKKFVDLQQGDTVYAGFRRAHAKGICVSGAFESNGSLAQYSTAPLFEKGATPFIGRYSVAGNNPNGNDLNAPVRSLALKFLLESGQEWRLAMNTAPVMAVGTPEEFYQQLVALSPDPVTKQRDPEKIKAFFKAHSESKAFTTWAANYIATNSFATEQYHSINAFYLIDTSGKQHAVRWTATPQTGAKKSALLDKTNADALQQEITNRIDQQPVRYNLEFTFANSNDNENDPTTSWPEQRLKVNAGTIVINAWESQNGGACNDINFNPLVLPEGIQPTEDPILRARSATYAESLHRRAKETLLNKHSSGEMQ